jgi:Rad3-related DNA helicase
MNSTSASEQQYTFIRNLIDSAYGKAEDNSFGKVFMKQAKADFRGATGFGKAMSYTLPALTSAQASQLISILRDRSADEILNRVAGDERLLKLFGENVSKFWTWMQSADGIVGMDEQEAIAKAQVTFGW